MENPVTRSRMAQLDGLRGLAALMVACAHYVLAFQPALLLGTGQPAGVALYPAALGVARSPLVLFFSPELGVAIFFVLSGYVLAASVTAKPVGLLELAVRRWIRLSLPMLLTTLPIWLWLTLRWHPDQALAARTQSQWLAMNYGWLAWEPNALHLAVYQSVFDVYRHGNAWWNTSLWTMRIEMIGSLGLFAAYRLAAWIAARAGARLVVAVAVMAACWGTHYMGFAGGAALFEIGAFRPARCWAWPGGMALLVAGAALGATPYYTAGWAPFAAMEHLLGHVSGNPGLLMRRVGALLLVAATLVLPPLRTALAARPFRFLGRISFMTYLLHVPILCAWVAWLVLHLAPRIGYGPATALAWPLFLATLLPLAALATRCIDRPSIRAAHAGAAWLRHQLSAAFFRLASQR